MSVKKLKEYAKSANIAVELDDECLAKIGQQVIHGFNEDKASMEGWLSDVKRIEELADLKSTKKNIPLPNSANVKLPIITKAAYEYAARAAPEIIKDDKVVKANIVGKVKDDFKKLMGQRVCDYMNYQMLVESNEWATQLNTLLLRLALIGFLVKKTYWDPIRKKLKSILCKPEELIINADSTSLDSAPRVSHILHWRLNDLIEYKNKTEDDVSLFLEKTVDELCERHKEDTLNKNIDGIEQCTYLDLDEDGYQEPYIVTTTMDGKVLRIVAQYEEEDVYPDKKDKVCYINKMEYYEDYHFLPNPKGNFQSVGFGILLLHMNESMNSILNQLLDSGSLANMKGGYMDARLKNLKGGDSRHTPGQFLLTKVAPGLTLKEGILPIDFGEPSNVLYQLLGLLMEVARDLSSSAQINIGTQSSENAKTGATLALQEEGKKLHNVVNQSVYRSLNKEFRHRFRLNAKYLDQEDYARILDDSMAIVSKDFDLKTFDICPVADPNLASDQQRLTEAAFIQQYTLSGLPVDPLKAAKAILERTTIPGILEILPDEKQEAPPNPEMIKLQAEMAHSQMENNLKEQELEVTKQDVAVKAALTKAQIEKIRAEIVGILAKAQMEGAKINLQQSQQQLDAVLAGLDMHSQVQQQQHDKEIQQADQMHQQNMQSMDQQHQQTMQQTEIDNTPEPTSGDSSATE